MVKKSRSVFIKRLKLQRVVNKKVGDRVYYGYKISFGETVLLNGFEWSGVRYVDLYRRDDGKVILVPILGCDLELSEDAE